MLASTTETHHWDNNYVTSLLNTHRVLGVDYLVCPLQYTHHLESGNSSISGLPDDTICSFYGSYQLQTSEVVDFEPVQCIMNRPPPPIIPLPPTSTEEVTTTTATDDVTTTATSSAASESESAATSISVATTKDAVSVVIATTTKSADTNSSATTADTNSTNATSEGRHV